MEAIVILIFLSLFVLVIMLIRKYFKGKKIISTDELYSQHGLTIEYGTGLIKIGKYSYDVKDVTGIKTEYSVGGTRHKQFIKIEVDDLVKPVHIINIVGSTNSADQFTQRICVALRKAGGRSFS